MHPTMLSIWICISHVLIGSTVRYCKKSSMHAAPFIMLLMNLSIAGISDASLRSAQHADRQGTDGQDMAGYGWLMVFECI